MFTILDDKNKALRTKCSEFSYPYQEEDIALLKEMGDYLKLSQDDEYAKANNITPGVGLACPQIGVTKRGFAIYLQDNDQIYKYGLLNPVILRTSVKRAYLSSGEGCLSVPKPHDGLIMRYNKIVVSAFDIYQMKEVTITAYGYLAICMQHELDHLDGILYYDHISKKDPYAKDPNAVEI